MENIKNICDIDFSQKASDDSTNVFVEEDGVFSRCNFKSLHDSQHVDYIFEQGIDGIWTYRKWASGIAECWGIQSVDNRKFESSLDNCAYTSSLFATYPTNLFIENPTVNVVANCDQYGLISTSPYNLRKDGFSLRLFTPQNALESWSGTIHINAKGKWYEIVE